MAAHIVGRIGWGVHRACDIQFLELRFQGGRRSHCCPAESRARPRDRNTSGQRAAGLIASLPSDLVTLRARTGAPPHRPAGISRLLAAFAMKNTLVGPCAVLLF